MRLTGVVTKPWEVEEGSCKESIGTVTHLGPKPTGMSATCRKGTREWDQGLRIGGAGANSQYGVWVQCTGRPVPVIPERRGRCYRSIHGGWLCMQSGESVHGARRDLNLRPSLCPSVPGRLR